MSSGKVSEAAITEIFGEVLRRKDLVGNSSVIDNRTVERNLRKKQGKLQPIWTSGFGHNTSDFNWRYQKTKGTWLWLIWHFSDWISRTTCHTSDHPTDDFSLLARFVCVTRPGVTVGVTSWETSTAGTTNTTSFPWCSGVCPSSATGRGTYGKRVTTTWRIRRTDTSWDRGIPSWRPSRKDFCFLRLPPSTFFD